MDDTVTTPAVNWTQRVGAFTGLPALISALGLDATSTLQGAGLDVDELDDATLRVSYHALGKLLDDIAKRSGCEHVGLLAGRMWHLADLGLVGELCRDSATVRHALDALVFHQQLISEGGAMFVLDRAGWVDIGYAICCPGVIGANQISEAVIAAGFNYMREMCGSAWRPTAVLFSHARPFNTSAHCSLFKDQPRFDAEYSALRFPSDWLNRRVEGASPARLRATQALAASAAASAVRAGLVQRVYSALRIGLVTGDCSGDDVARQLSLHRRTLNRRLRVEGRTIQGMLDEMRFETAKQLLARSRLSLDDVAAAVGYAGVTQFIRRFRRWSGISPGTWRREAREARRLRSELCTAVSNC